jgi:hypothetical protein
MLAAGNVPIQYRQLPAGFKGTDDTAALMCQLAMGIYGARSPKIRALARNILVQKRVPEKDYVAEAIALGEWVRDNIRYMRDPYGQETLAHPEETAFNMRAGDCDDLSVLAAALLGSVGIPSRFKVMGVTPFQYSHVYLQAQPTGKDWITMDPIMKDKPMGWEAPAPRRVIEKTYPTNLPEGLEGYSMRGINGLGYVGDNRVVSFLDDPLPPPPKTPPYVVQPSGLDTDADVNSISAGEHKIVMGGTMPEYRTRSIAPQLRYLTDTGLVDARPDRPELTAAPGSIPGMGQMEADAFSGQNRVLGPDFLAALTPGLDRQTVPAYMQTKTMVQKPEGVDLQFSRAALVMDPAIGDKVNYFGTPSLSDRGINRPYKGMAGVGILPGMGGVGPGMGAGATGTEAMHLAADLPAGAPVAASKLPLKMLGVVAVGIAALYFIRRNRRNRKTR